MTTMLGAAAMAGRIVFTRLRRPIGRRLGREKVLPRGSKELLAIEFELAHLVSWFIAYSTGLDDSRQVSSGSAVIASAFGDVL
jgi:hypothetical protein